MVDYLLIQTSKSKRRIFFKNLGVVLNSYLSKYEHIILLGDLNLTTFNKYLADLMSLFKGSRVVEIVSFDCPKKTRNVIFFRLLSFCFEIKGLSLTYQKVSSKNNLHFLVKPSTENSYFRVNIFYLDELQLPMKISK